MGRNWTLDELFSGCIPEPNTGCWIWLGGLTSDGYAALSGVPWTGHKSTHEKKYGKVPAGMELHLRCKMRPCINPDHTRRCTHAENIRQSNAMGRHNSTKTHCKRGHALAGANLIIEPMAKTPQGFARKCAECRRITKRARYNKRKG